MVKATFMTQELIDLRASIQEGRYEYALAIIDELEGMSKQAILRNIEDLLSIVDTYESWFARWLGLAGKQRMSH